MRWLIKNGIIHQCTHPNDDGLSAALSEKDVMLGIFAAINRIVSQIVKPKKILFMAIDGVAPRAKLNQQRSRRFAAAKDRFVSLEVKWLFSWHQTNINSFPFTTRSYFLFLKLERLHGTVLKRMGISSMCWVFSTVIASHPERLLWHVFRNICGTSFVRNKRRTNCGEVSPSFSAGKRKAKQYIWVDKGLRTKERKDVPVCTTMNW